ncbi:hypothetical protein M433DRAFT_152183 [Acidomyces richmondensis BFW]|nr:MAG: hypothetical protein FE78DRAFT_86910 [Acidomyces sp. 'richmondensis']KYG47494.1 hypothetical protein M433DRAFT_152183 [Acidomyces richmondensis BFW]
MSHYITTHDSSAKAIFSDKVPIEHKLFPLPGGAMRMIGTAHAIPANISTEADIDQYAQDRTYGLPNNAFCPPRGAAAAIVTFEPGAESVMHRTSSLDFLVIIEGIVELHLDSGEMRTLKSGDSVIQRGTMHKWVNKTPNGGEVKMVGKWP